MTTYRRMRRQARQARRSGLQPMMVINSGEPFPETVGVVLLRWAWRYRSELAPLGVTAAIVGAAWWLHATGRTGGRSSSASLPWPHGSWLPSARGSGWPR